MPNTVVSGAILLIVIILKKILKPKFKILETFSAKSDNFKPLPCPPFYQIILCITKPLTVSVIPCLGIWNKFKFKLKIAILPSVVIPSDYCVQPFTVKQRCVLNKCISNNDNFYLVDIRFLHNLIQTGKRAYHWRDRESTEKLSTKFRKFYKIGCFGWQYFM
jgi:hypothetical protein